MDLYEIGESKKLAVKHKYEFYTYKDEWDKVKEELDLTDEELRKEVSISLQMWVWADILDDVRNMVLIEREHQNKKGESG